MPIPKKKIKALHQKISLSVKWRNIEHQLNEIGGVWRFDDPLRFDDLQTLKYMETDTYLYVLARLEKPMQCTCSSANNSMEKNGSTEVLRIMDLPVHKKKVVIFYTSQRYLCSECGKSAQSISPEINDSHRMTERLFRFVREESLSTLRTFTSIENEVGVDNLVIRNIHSEYVSDLQLHRVVDYSPWIAIDEVYPTSRKEPRCVISAPLEERILDILVDNNAVETLGPFLLQIKDREKIEVVSMDLWDPYRAVVKQVLPHASIVCDRFHVSKTINEALKDVVSVIRLTLTPAEGKKYLCRESTLLICGLGSKSAKKSGGYSEISNDKRKSLELMFDRLPDVSRAYLLKEEFSQILNLSDVSEAERKARRWLDKVREFVSYFYKKYKIECHSVGRHPFKNVVSTVNSWFDEILNYVRFGDRFGKRVTNAYAENINRKIKELNRLGYGYDFQILRSKFVFGGVKKKCSSDPVKIIKKRKSYVRGRNKVVNPNSNVSQVVRSCEISDATLDLIPNPILNKDYAKRCPLIIDESPGKTNRRGTPVRESRRTRIKVKVKDRRSSQFGEDSSVREMINSNSQEQIPMFQEGLEEKIQDVGNSNLLVVADIENCDSSSSRMYKSKSSELDKCSQCSSLPLFDFQSETQSSFTRV